MMFTLFKKITGRRAMAVALALGFAATAQASRLKDLTLVEGGRENQLVGYGLVVGLAGDGDSNAVATLRSVANLLQRYGLTVALDLQNLTDEATFVFFGVQRPGRAFFVKTTAEL